MQTITTPFGRRALSFAHIAAQLRTGDAVEAAALPGSNHPSAVNKWTLFRTLTQIRERLGISDRTLNLLNALLSFHPETALTLPDPQDDEEAGLSCDLVVFPSNRALMLRASGMAEKTVRRHLAALVEAGLIIRRDSPNGKRYARKDVTGAERFSDVYGFDLTPLVVRAPEFDALAEEERRVARARAALKERISLRRRDAAKLIALGLDEQVPGDWEALRHRFMGLVTPLRRLLEDTELERVAADLAELCAEASIMLETQALSINMTGNAGDDDRHQSNSNADGHSDLEPASKEEGGIVPLSEPLEPLETKMVDPVSDTVPLGLVLEACPDVKEYQSGSIRSWSQFTAAAKTIRPMLGISPDAWSEAVAAMGEQIASIVIGVILQRSEYSSEARMITDATGKQGLAVNNAPVVLSPGGYLRALTVKAGAGAFSPGPVLMALIGQRLRVKRGGNGAKLES